MFGLMIDLPQDASSIQQQLLSLLTSLDIPVAGFLVREQHPIDQSEDREAFIRTCIQALLTPGQPICGTSLLKHLTDEPLMANIIRRYVFLQYSLVPYLHTGCDVTPLDGGHMVGHDLIVCHLNEHHQAAMQLPEGRWTDIMTGDVFSGAIREVRSLNACPVLARSNSVIAVGVNDRSDQGCDADRVTLHWYEPQASASCTLADGTTYHLRCENDSYAYDSDTSLPWHLIVHNEGDEILVR